MGASTADRSGADGQSRPAAFGLAPGPGGLEDRRTLVTARGRVGPVTLPTTELAVTCTTARMMTSTSHTAA
jgi:hypothetical protein